MGVDAKRLLDLKAGVDRLAQQRDRLKWERESLEKQLLEEFGLKTADEALKEALKREKERAKLEVEFTAALTKVGDEYQALLELTR
jgi:branched-subunit amino acid aminotransferase/4-amino-4-deoxychorismate lyase